MKTSLHVKLIFAGLALCLSIPFGSSAQVIWEKYDGNPVLQEFGPAWTVTGVSSPCVIYENGTFKMWFTAEGNIGYAESIDGITWTPNTDPVIHKGEAGNWDAKRGHPCVIRVNDTLKMWFSGSPDDFNWEISIGYAWSVDNISWNVLGDPILEKGAPGSWEENAVYQPAVYYNGNTYQMWYNGYEGDLLTDPDRVGYATSSNGINWVKYSNNPVMNLGEDGTFFDTWIQSSCVTFMDDTFRMWFSGYDAISVTPMRYFRIGYATSPDGIVWTVENDSMAVLDHGPSGAWDESRVISPSVIVHEDQYKMWYAGFDYFSYRIGYATDGWVNPGIFEENSRTSIQSFCYPNPLSSQATIEYDLIDQALVELKIFNYLGKEIDILVSEFQKAGTHQAVWNSEGLSAGIYFYRLKAGAHVGCGKIIKR